MEHNLRIDNLTGIFNRDFLYARIKFLQQQAKTTQRQPDQPHFALLFLDVDRFKAINDQYGHDIGDQILITVASRLKAATRTTDIVARYGGDEFVVLLSDVNSAALASAGEEKIRAMVEAPMQQGKIAIDIRISIGWALFPLEAQDTETLLKIADTRMFDVKRQRRKAIG